MSRRKAILFVCIVGLILLLAFHAFFINSAFLLVHETLGDYGLQIEAHNGYDVTGTLGVWFAGYTTVENTITIFGVVNFVLGFILASILIGVFYLVKETQLEEKEKP